MRLFFLIYLVIYGGMQGYVGWKLWPALARPPGARWLLAGWLLLMVGGPLLAFAAERAGYRALASFVGSLAWTWMAVSLWLLTLGLAADGWNLGVRAAAHFAPAAAAWKLSPRAFVVGAGVLVALALAWGHFVQARWLAVKHVNLTVPRLPPGRASLTVALVSDLHLGLYADPRHLANVTRTLHALAPDLLVSAGDLVDSAPDSLAGLAAEWRTLTPPLGKLAVLGNHDFYAGEQASVKFHEEAGFRLLRQEHVELAPGFVVAGVDDPAARFLSPTPRTNERLALPPPAPDQTVLLLKHQPRVAPDSAARYTLQLSGHTHRGQLFPFTLIIAAVYPYHYGLYTLPGGARLYVSPGTATWGPQLRLGTTSEITVFHLRAAPNPSPSVAP